MRLPTNYDYHNHQLQKILSVDGITSVDYTIGMHHDTAHHRHETQWELCCCISGEFFVYMDTAYLPMRASEALLVPPGTEHDSLISDPDVVSFYVSFSCLSELLAPLSGRILPVTPEQDALLQQIISEVSQAYEMNDGMLRIFNFTPAPNSPLGAEQMISNALEQFLILMLRNATMQNGKVATGDQLSNALENYLVETVIEYIKTHIAEGLTVAGVADAFHYSRSRLHNYFKTYCGHSVREYITNEQLSLAKQLLIDGELSVTEISERTGFSSPQYFSRKFTESVGCPPSQFLKRYPVLTEK